MPHFAAYVRSRNDGHPLPAQVVKRHLVSQLVQHPFVGHAFWISASAGAFYVLLEPVDRHLALFATLWRVGEARMLAAFGMLASGHVTVVAFANLIVPARAAGLSFGWEWAPMFAAEIATGLWLLVAGPDLAHRDDRQQGSLAT